MGRLVHFEIQADNMESAMSFYKNVFGWSFQDWGQFSGIPYWGVITGDEKEPGINGGLVQRESPIPEGNQGANGFVCTMAVEDYNSTEAKILENGGKISVPKTALTGMAWQGYYFDTEGNIFGIHQPDPNAK